MYRMLEDNNSLELGSDENLLWLINYSQRLTSLGQLPKFNSTRTKIPTCRIRTDNSMGDIILVFLKLARFHSLKIIALKNSTVLQNTFSVWRKDLIHRSHLYGKWPGNYRQLGRIGMCFWCKSSIGQDWTLLNFENSCQGDKLRSELILFGKKLKPFDLFPIRTSLTYINLSIHINIIWK